MLKLPLVAASTLLAGVVVATAAHADPPIYPPRYGSNGTFGVGNTPRDGVTSYIPPGRYTVEQSPGPTYRPRIPGFWLRCNGIPCTPTHPEHIIGNGDLPDATVIDILPTDVAVYLLNVTLTFAP